MTTHSAPTTPEGKPAPAYLGIQFNHAEGLVAEKQGGSGAGGVWLNHAEGLVA